MNFVRDSVPLLGSLISLASLKRSNLLKRKLVLVASFVAVFPIIGANGEQDTPTSQTFETKIEIPHKLSPCQWDSRSSSCTGPGIFMDEIITIEIDGTRFTIPAIYFTAWAKPEDLGRVIVHTRNPHFPLGFGFAFWMPTRRPEEIKTLPPMVIPELLRRGARPALGEFPVTVISTRFARADDPDLILPERQFKNLLAADSGPSGDVFEQRYGLEYFKGAKDRLGLDHYHTVSKGQPQLLFRCSSDVAYPGCDGDVYFAEDGLSFRIAFPYRNLGDWKQTLEAAHELVLGWRQKSN